MIETENAVFLHPNRTEVETECGTLTDAQWTSLERLRSRWNEIEGQRCPEFGGYGALMVRFGNLWVGIERDGYAHS